MSKIRDVCCPQGLDVFLRLELYAVSLSAWFGCVSKIRAVCCPQGLDVFLRLEMYAVGRVWMCF